MLEDIRRQISGYKRAKRERITHDIEKQRRLSYISAKQLRERQELEEELISQRRSEMQTLEDARKAYRERKLAEKELKHLKAQTGTAARMRRGVSTLIKVPYQITKTGASAKGSSRLHNLIFAPRGFWGPSSTSPKPTTPKESKKDIDDFIFGKPESWL